MLKNDIMIKPKSLFISFQMKNNMNNKIYLNTLALILISVLLSSCAGGSKAEGPLFSNTSVSDESLARIIIYRPIDSHVISYIKETYVYIDTKKIAPLSLGGYHVYEMEPGVHVLTVNNNERVAESIVLNLRPNETVYLKYPQDKNYRGLHILERVFKSAALREVSNNKLQYKTKTPISDLDLQGRAYVTKRNNQLSLVHRESNNPAYNFLFNPPSSYFVNTGSNHFTANLPYMLYSTGLSSSTGDIELTINAKSNCVYLVQHEQLNTDIGAIISLDHEEFCNVTSDETKT